MELCVFIICGQTSSHTSIYLMLRATSLICSSKRSCCEMNMCKEKRSVCVCDVKGCRSRKGAIAWTAPEFPRSLVGSVRLLSRELHPATVLAAELSLAFGVGFITFINDESKESIFLDFVLDITETILRSSLGLSSFDQELHFHTCLGQGLRNGLFKRQIVNFSVFAGFLYSLTHLPFVCLSYEP